MQGGEGDDILNGGLGADMLIGGVGFDTASYAGGAAVQIDLSTNTFEGDASGDTLDSIEKIIGSAFDDTLTGDSGDNIFEGGASADRIYGGTAGSDTGSDTASYASSDAGVTIDLTIGGAQGGAGHATGDELTDIENLIGSAFDDTLTGDSGDNIFEGGLGADTITGGAGSDTVSYATSDKGVTALLNASDGEQGGFGVGHEKGDILKGIDNLIGSAFVDTLTGKGGENTLEGGAGDDILNGGGGEDTYVFGVGDGSDTITDADGTMVLRFDGDYELGDFVTTYIKRVDDNLEITVDKDSGDGIDDKITINNVYKSDDTSAFSITIQYGTGDSFTEVMMDFWNIVP